MHIHSYLFHSLIWVFASLCLAKNLPTVSLGYAKYEGKTLANGINQFLGMRYAASPVGRNRFRLPKPPAQETGTVSAKKHGPVCFGVKGLIFPTPNFEYSEDCLFIDVFAPTRTSSELLPVMIWIGGGGFVQLVSPNYNGTGLIEAGNKEIVIVAFNYRVGPYGFLASEELQQERNLNIGLHDQRAAISWVQQYIHKFGGDPDRVTLFGSSIGAGSMLLHTLAYEGNPPPHDNTKWKAGIGESVFIPSVYTVKDLRFQYNDLLSATNCTNLACLRSLSSNEIQAANTGRPFPGQTDVPLFPYGPVVDGKLLTDRPEAMLDAGKFARDKAIAIGGSLTEGTLFVPQANTTEDIGDFMKTQFPRLTDKDLEKANEIYSSVPSTFPGVVARQSPLYYRLAKIYGDNSFFCPILEFTSSFNKVGIDVHLFRNNIRDPVEVAAGFIVPHTWAIEAFWGPEYANNIVQLPNADSYELGGVNSGIVPIVQKYWISFAQTLGDPNTLAAGTPSWHSFIDGQRLRLQSNATAMESISQADYKRCAFWKSVTKRTRI